MARASRKRARVDEEAFEALAHAIYQSSLRVLRILVKGGLSPHVVDRERRTLLAVTDPHPDNARIIELLLDHGLSPDVLRGERSFLGEACMVGETEIVRLLLRRGADPEFEGGEPVRIAAETANGRSVEILELLHRAGARLDRIYDDDQTLLHRAVVGRNERALRWLVGKGLDLLAEDSRGKTALDLARFQYRVMAPWLEKKTEEARERAHPSPRTPPRRGRPRR